MDLAFYAIIIAATLVTLSLALLPVFAPTDWADDYGARPKWKKLSINSAILGIAAIVISGIGLKDSNVWLIIAGVFSSGIITVCLIQSLFTDYKLRMVDRRLLNAASVVTGTLGGGLLLNNQDWITLSVTVALLLFATFVYLFIFSVGASDARALCLVAVGIIPVIGYNGFVWASLGAGIYFIILGFGVAFIKRTMRSSFPAVPMLIFPYWVVLMLLPFVTLGSAFPNIPSI